MSFLRILTRKHLALLWSSQVLSAMGDYFYAIAVIWIAIQVAGSAGSVVAAAESGTALLFGLLGGIFADRWNRRTTMIVVDIMRALIVGTLPVLARVGALQLWYLILVAIAIGSLGALFDPALQASLPALTENEKTLQATNGLMDITRRLARVLGPSVAGLLVIFMPLSQFFTLDAISFLISAIAILLMGRRFAWKPEIQEQTKHGLRGMFEELSEAIKLVHHHTTLAWAMVTNGIVNIAWAGAFTIGAPLLAERILKANVGAYGLIVGAYGVGNVLSNLVIGSIPIRRHYQLTFIGRLIAGGGFLLMVSVPVLPIALLGSAIAALGGPMSDIPLLMMMQTDLPSHQLGKVYSLRVTLANGGVTIGLLLAAPLFAYVSVPLAIALCALVIIGTSVAGFLQFGWSEPQQKFSKGDTRV